jgi:cation transport ATPase
MTDMDDLVRFIVERRDHFTREGIDTTLRKGGHDQVAIDAAWAASNTAGASKPKPGMGTTIVMLLGLLAIVGAYGFGVFAALVLTRSNVYSGTWGAAFMLVWAVTMTGGGLYSVRRLVRAASSTKPGKAVLAALGVSIAIYAGLIGLGVVGIGVATDL